MTALEDALDTNLASSDAIATYQTAVSSTNTLQLSDINTHVQSLANKQNGLTAGSGISLETDIISLDATSLANAKYRGKPVQDAYIHTWADERHF